MISVQIFAEKQQAKEKEQLNHKTPVWSRDLFQKFKDF